MAESSLPLETRLLNIKGFSDFTLACHGKKFGLQKATICSQSSVMANTLRGGFEEATASFLRIPFDIESVNRLVEFMYIGDYQLSPDPTLEPLSSSESDNSNAEVSTGDVKPGLSNGTYKLGIPTTVSERLTCHTRMDSIASYYDIPALSTLSRSKVDDILVHEWSADAFCDLIRESLD
ncbi:hypothetical protein F5B21DRAFT_502920 [Xylaria acuta]|nr:hypothetical protein F5B21DRAFT_502920 [Xylaria acuta]